MSEHHTSRTEQTRIPEAATGIAFEPIDRGSLLLKGALAFGALYGGAAVSPFVRRAFGQQNGGQGEIDVLNFALTLEYLEADFYVQAVAELDLGSELESLATDFGDAEQAHVDALSSTITDLGGTPAEEPEFSFGLNNRNKFLELAITLEDTGVGAYNGAAPALQGNDELLSTAGSIVQVEARHAAAVRQENGDQPVLNAFDEGLGMDEVLSRIEPFIQS